MEEASEPPTEVWPDNLPAVNFFIALGAGSWSIGPGGPVGLRPEAFREVRLAQGIRACDWPDIFEDLRVLEDAALETMRLSK